MKKLFYFAALTLSCHVTFSQIFLNTQTGTKNLTITDNQICLQSQNDFYVNNANLGNGNVWLGKSGAGLVTAMNNFNVTGNVGIGTTAPGVKLSVDATENQTTLGANASSAIRITNGYTNNFGRRSELQFATNQASNGLFAVIAGEYSNSGTTAGGDLIFGTSSGSSSTSMTQRMRISSTGQISMGNPLQNTSPHFNTYSLSVKGKIVAQEIIVTQSNWSDFVFDSSYKLMTLNELENYYQTNHHLPEVPSTKEITENGNDLGKTDALLLQKIEELTLYVVELQKQIEDLRSKNK